MKLPVTLGALSLSILACTGLDDTGAAAETAATAQADWTINELALAPNSLFYAEVSGTATLNQALAAYGTTAEVRYFSDEYETLIEATSETIGGDLDEAGTTQEFAITHYKVYVEPAIDGYARVCAEFRADDSNLEDWTRAGCLP